MNFGFCNRVFTHIDRGFDRLFSVKMYFTNNGEPCIIMANVILESVGWKEPFRAISHFAGILQEQAQEEKYETGFCNSFGMSCSFCSVLPCCSDYGLGLKKEIQYA